MRRAFWLTALGHALGLTVSVIAMLAPPIWWAGGWFWRDFAVHWSMLILALVGCAIAFLLSPDDEMPGTPRGVPGSR